MNYYVIGMSNVILIVVHDMLCSTLIVFDIVCFQPHIVGSLHHIVYCIAYNIARYVSFDSNLGSELPALSLNDQRFICRFVFRLLHHWRSASAPTAPRLNSYVPLPHPTQAC